MIRTENEGFREEERVSKHASTRSNRGVSTAHELFHDQGRVLGHEFEIFINRLFYSIKAFCHYNSVLFY